MHESFCRAINEVVFFIFRRKRNLSIVLFRLAEWTALILLKPAFKYGFVEIGVYIG